MCACHCFGRARPIAHSACIARELTALKKKIAEEEAEEARLRPRTEPIDATAIKTSPGEFIRVALSLLARQYVNQFLICAR
jgi:hypothetical protein